MSEQGCCCGHCGDIGDHKHDFAFECYCGNKECENYENPWGKQLICYYCIPNGWRCEICCVWRSAKNCYFPKFRWEHDNCIHNWILDISLLNKHPHSTPEEYCEFCAERIQLKRLALPGGGCAFAR